MAKNKAELQSEAVRYRRAVSAMRKAHKEGRILDAIQTAKNACEFADGMMQFERRFEKRPERKSIEAIDYVLQYAPLVFDLASLETLAGILKSQRRIDKNTVSDIGECLQQAFELIWDAHRLWSILVESDEIAQDKLRVNLDGDQERWRRIAETWDRMGLIRRIPERGSYRISLTTRITAEVRGKCRGCGAIGKAALGTFLEEITCPKCKVTSDFVILAGSDPATS
jgi:phage FluMu protein Com